MILYDLKRYLEKQLKEEEVSEIEALLKNPDHDQYLTRRGKVLGLRKARDLMVDVINRFEEDEDFD